MKLALSVSLLLVIGQYVEAQYRDGDIRLVGGSYQWEGRVEIYKSGRWGTITDTQWSIGDAQVVCRKLGHFKPGAVPQHSAYFGEGSDPIHMDYISCTGTEYNLTDCETRSTSRQSNHSENVGVQCQPADGSYREGDIRLVGGSHDWEGRVEVYMAGTWGTVSDDDWREDDAQVVCRQLGFPTDGAVAQCCAHYGQGSGPVQVQNIVCSGSEPTISECSHSGTPGSDHNMDIGVQCAPRTTAVRPGFIRLVERPFQWQGRLEIFLSGAWGSVSRELFRYQGEAQLQAAIVVCRQLGYTGDSVYASAADRVVRGRGPIAITSPICSGNEYRLTDCTYSLDTAHLTHRSDWAVECSAASPREGDIDLRDDPLYVFVDGRWGTVSSDAWTAANSRVACRQMGYSIADSSTPRFWSETHDENDPPQLISRVTCTGTESKLLDCPHEVTRELNDVRIRCNQNTCSTGQMRLVGGNTSHEGRLEICLKDWGSWGTICNNQWSLTHTKVACRYFGFGEEGIFLDSSKFDQGIGPILAGYINCKGSESSIFDCPHFQHSYTGCTHNNDVGIRCEPAACDDGQIRLVRGIRVDERWGALQVCFNQRWGVVQNYYDSIDVVCYQLGFGEGRDPIAGAFIKAVLPVYLTYIRCFGTESNILDCSYGNNTNSEDQYVSVSHGISCRDAICAHGEVRLIDGENEWEGRLEVCINYQRWGTVSDDGWSEDNAQVVCKDLGYEINPSEFFYNPEPSGVSRPIHMHNVNCSGSEGTLKHCSNSSGSPYNHGRDVGVKCQRSSCRDGDVRLVNGRNIYEGLVHVCFNQSWGTIYNDGWNKEEYVVLCRQLGFSNSEVYYHDYILYDTSLKSVSSPVYMNDVECSGHEQRITDCSYGLNKYAYHYSADVLVRCPSPASIPTEYTTSEPTEYTTSEPTEYTTSEPTEYTTSEPTEYTTSEPSASEPSGSYNDTDHESPSDGCECPTSVSSTTDESETSDKNNSKCTALLVFAIVSWVITALAVAVAFGTTIHHCLGNRKKIAACDRVQLQNRSSNDSVCDIVDAGDTHTMLEKSVLL